MAKRGKGGGRRFVRDAIGRFARTAGKGAASAGGRVAKAAFAAAESELTEVAKASAKRAVQDADEAWRKAKKQYNAARRASEIPDDVFDEIEADYKKAIRDRAAAKAKLAAASKGG